MPSLSEIAIVPKLVTVQTVEPTISPTTPLVVPSVTEVAVKVTGFQLALFSTNPLVCVPGMPLAIATSPRHILPDAAAGSTRRRGAIVFGPPAAPVNLDGGAGFRVDL
jgi:hypothetical protein